MNQLQVLNYQQNEVRVVMQDGKPWWVLKDVCEVLCLSNSRRVSDRLDEDEKGVTLVNTLGGNQEMTVINESGLYNVIIRSDKPEAKQFKRWITHDVLPSIRKHGIYATDELLANPDLLIQVATALKAERAENARLQSEITASKPKVLFADSVSVSGDTILIGELAKILKGNGVDIGQNRLYEKLRQMGYLIKRNSILSTFSLADNRRCWLMNRLKLNKSGYPDPTAYAALVAVSKSEKARAYKPLVYIASPFAGDVPANIANAKRYCKFAVRRNAIPLAPHLLYPQFMDDSDTKQRKLGLFFALVLLGKCDELWVCGDTISKGMSAEIAKATKRGMPIRYFTTDCEEKQDEY